jgi:hypothetical protein
LYVYIYFSSDGVYRTEVDPNFPSDPLTHLRRTLARAFPFLGE